MNAISIEIVGRFMDDAEHILKLKKKIGVKQKENFHLSYAVIKVEETSLQAPLSWHQLAEHNEQKKLLTAVHVVSVVELLGQQQLQVAAMIEVKRDDSKRYLKSVVSIVGMLRSTSISEWLLYNLLLYFKLTKKNIDGSDEMIFFYWEW